MSSPRPTSRDYGTVYVFDAAASTARQLPQWMWTIGCPLLVVLTR
jgi:hypothetical protein